MVRETSLSTEDLIYPLFVTFGKGVKKKISSMPGCFQMSVDEIVKEAHKAYKLGIPAVILFGIPELKDAKASQAYSPKGVVQEAIRSIVLNDPTLELLAREALSHAKAGADIVAPSDMMDGRVAVIRDALDSDGFDEIPIISYAAKYSSAFYGPFREAAESTPAFGDRRTYQMDPANRREAIKEVALDIEEGADIVMVKPAMSYMDIIADVKDAFDLPVAAYNVSGEYSMIKAAARLGWIDETKVMMELLLSFKRAGADLILTYHAVEAAKELNK
jgi:porphobilinogen synthase